MNFLKLALVAMLTAVAVSCSAGSDAPRQADAPAAGLPSFEQLRRHSAAIFSRTPRGFIGDKMSEKTLYQRPAPAPSASRPRRFTVLRPGSHFQQDTR